MLFLRSFWFYIGMIVSLLVFFPFPLLAWLLPYRQRYQLLISWGHFVLWWLEKTCHLTYQVEGLENLPQTPVILLSKHQSAWETFAFLKIFPMQVWVLKRELLWIPVFGWGLAALRPIAIKRTSIRKSLQQIIEQGKQHLADGRWILVFPEGTRVAPGEKKRYGIGGAILAAQSGYPVIPIAHNSGTFWSRQAFIKRPGTIQVHIGPMIESSGKNYQQINSLAEEWIEQTMLRL